MASRPKKTSDPQPAPLLQSLDLLETIYGRTRFIPRFDPMEELISCILSQSSSDSSSFPAFTRLRAAFPDWLVMAQAPPEEITPLIKAAGLANQKTKAIQSCLKEIYARLGNFDLEFLRSMPEPEAMKWLTSLAGVGPKTASIVLCFAFGRAAIPVDTHVHRVSQRLGWIGPKTNETKAHKELSAMVPAQDAWRFHTLLIQHGRLICKAPKPICTECPLLELCPKLGLAAASTSK